MFDIIIVGAGPAGMTAAIYALRARKKVLILESKSYGGQIINSSRVENYPGVKNTNGFELATIMYNQVKELGGEIKIETVVKIDKDKNVYTNLNTYQGKAIIIATGVQNKKIGIENESEFIGRGISYCATCDGNFYKGKVVAVVGGGNTALEDALYLSNVASKVYLIHRRSTFRGDEKYVNELRNKGNVEFILNSNVRKINGTKKIESIDIENDNNDITSLNIDGLFIAIGQEPNNNFLGDILELDNGYIVTNEDLCTNIKGIYAAGDARVKSLRQLVTATSDGAIAITSAIKHLDD